MRAFESSVVQFAHTTTDADGRSLCQFLWDAICDNFSEYVVPGCGN